MTARDAYLEAWREIQLTPSLSRFELNPVIEYVRELEEQTDALQRRLDASQRNLANVMREYTSNHAEAERLGEGLRELLEDSAGADPPRLPGIIRCGRRVLIDLDKLETRVDAGGHRARSGT